MLTPGGFAPGVKIHKIMDVTLLLLLLLFALLEQNTVILENCHEFLNFTNIYSCTNKKNSIH
jgi:hypothetical protein